MTVNLFEQGAFHESGHIVMAYLVGFKSDQVALIQDDPGSAFTKFDYGDDPRMTHLIAAMQNYSNDPSFYSELADNIKAKTAEVAERIALTLVGGPVCEAFYRTGIDFNGELDIEMSGPDLMTINSIDFCLQQNVTNHDPNFVENLLRKAAQLVRGKQVWITIEHLSQTLLNSENKILNRTQIESSLATSGYLKLIGCD